jgi:hypothetical protein
MSRRGSARQTVAAWRTVNVRHGYHDGEAGLRIDLAGSSDNGEETISSRIFAHYHSFGFASNENSAWRISAESAESMASKVVASGVAAAITPALESLQALCSLRAWFSAAGDRRCIVCRRHFYQVLAARLKQRVAAYLSSFGGRHRARIRSRGLGGSRIDIAAACHRAGAGGGGACRRMAITWASKQRVDHAWGWRYRV